ncbi:MAG: hypothetical protein ACON4N_14890 [Myxococcota bacterium]
MRRVSHMGCAMVLLLTGCLARRAPTPATPVDAVPPLKLDVAGLYDGGSNPSFYATPTDPSAMQRLLMEPDALKATPERNPDVEPWLLRLLLTQLTARGTQVYGPPHAQLPQFAPIDPAPLSPTADLTDLTLVSGVDQLPAIVWTDGGGITHLELRAHDDQKSLCPSDWTAPVRYVRFSAHLQRYVDGALLARLEGSSLLPSPDDVVVDLAEPQGANACDAITHALVQDDRLQPHVVQFERAADRLVRTLLDPLYSTGP